MSFVKSAEIKEGKVSNTRITRVLNMPDRRKRVGASKMWPKDTIENDCLSPN